MSTDAMKVSEYLASEAQILTNYTLNGVTYHITTACDLGYPLAHPEYVVDGLRSAGLL
jgi:hypothetical protein